VSACEVLLGKGIDINTCDKKCFFPNVFILPQSLICEISGQTPLMGAAYQESLSVVKLLVESKVDINAKNA
jgi:hypothetical protein